MTSCTSDGPSKTPDEQLQNEGVSEEMESKRRELEERLQQIIKANTINGCYSREFMMISREIQKNYATISCPLTAEEIEELGLSGPGRRRVARSFHMRGKGGCRLKSEERKLREEKKRLHQERKRAEMESILVKTQTLLSKMQLQSSSASKESS